MVKVGKNKSYGGIILTAYELLYCVHNLIDYLVIYIDIR